LGGFCILALGALHTKKRSRTLSEKDDNRMDFIAVIPQELQADWAST
jgi:hypothetical protein